MDNERELIPALYGRGLLDKILARTKELDMSKETLRRIIGTPRTTFYRIINNTDREVHMDLDFALRACLALGLSIDELLRKPPEVVTEITPALSETVQKEVMQNVAEVLEEKKQAIEAREGKIENLSNQLEEKSQIESEYLNKILEMHSEIRVLHEYYNRRIEELQKELSRRQDQLCDLALKIAGK